MRTVWFALPFVSIGLETRRTDLLTFLIFGGWFVAVPLT